MKTNILRLVPEKYLPDAIVDNTIIRKVAASYIDLPTPEASKAWRGFNHTVTARLLCPAKYIEQFKRDPEGYVGRLVRYIHILTTKRRTRQDLKHRRLRLIDRESYPFFPIFLYDEDMTDGTATKGLFHGPLLVKVCGSLPLKLVADEHSQAYRYIFLGPSQNHAIGAKGSKKKGKRCNPRHAHGQAVKNLLCGRTGESVHCDPRLSALIFHDRYTSL